MAAILSLPCHSFEFPLCYLTSLWNGSNFQVSMYCALNLLLSVSRRSSSVLHTSCSAWVRASKSCRPCLPSQFFCKGHSFCLGYTIVLKFILYLHFKFLSSAYLSVVLQSNVSSFMMGLLSLGLTFYTLWLLTTLAIIMACTTTLPASAATWTTASVIFTCSVAIIACLSVCMVLAFVT